MPPPYSTTVLHRRLRRAVLTLPTRRGWAETVAAGLIAGWAAYALGRRTGLFTPGAARTGGLARTVLTTFFVPALGEELLFRAAMVPSRAERGSARTAITVSTALFTAWHVLEARTFLRAAAPVFLRPDFLLIAALEGAVCAALLRRTGSVWPGVLLHSAEVVVWKLWLGGSDVVPRRRMGPGLN